MYERGIFGIFSLNLTQIMPKNKFEGEILGLNDMILLYFLYMKIILCP